MINENKLNDRSIYLELLEVLSFQLQASFSLR